MKIKRSTGEGDDRLEPPKAGSVSGFAIYIDTLCQGAVAIERDEANNPVVYAMEEAAQREIVETTIARLEQFLAGERDFDDAVTVEEYVMSVELHPDGSISDEDGRVFPNEGW